MSTFFAVTTRNIINSLPRRAKLSWRIDPLLGGVLAQVGVWHPTQAKNND
jgi:hypothetical protein